ncbi:MAG: putative glycolipid-binding domain-containing protein [Sporichthyaceae bacterium]|nr:putative glycolipid-binding domain-containing protein [Sporichthyaceae bacterium]
MRTVLWRSDSLSATETCRLAPTGTGHTLSGTVLLPFDGRPAEVRYLILVDELWHTRATGVSVRTDGRPRHLSLGSDGAGNWHVNESSAPMLAGCSDVDLGVSPATNTLPIRRLASAAGDVVAVRAAWVKFPELTVEVLEQTYERLDRNRWQYRAGNFSAELTVDSAGLILRYGDDLWTALAHSDPVALA